MKLNRELVCIAIFLIIAAGYPLIGPSPYNIRGFLSWFMGNPVQGFEPELALKIIRELRLPRLIAGLLCGSALAVAGVLSQGLFRNPLAAPGVLGFSGGSSLFVLILYTSGIQWLPEISVPLVAFAGAVISSLILLMLTKKFHEHGFGYLLLSGMALSSLWGALNSFFISVSLEKYQVLQAMMRWLLGGLNAATWEHLWWSLIPFIAGLWWAYRLTRKLDVLALGQEVAQSLSVDVQVLKFQCIACMSLLVGMVVSMAGPLPFVGLIVPHITRMMMGPSHGRLMVFSMLNGAVLIMTADFLCRTLFVPGELELGVLTSLLGAPFFFWLLCHRKKEVFC